MVKFLSILHCILVSVSCFPPLLSLLLCHDIPPQSLIYYDAYIDNITSQYQAFISSSKTFSVFNNLDVIRSATANSRQQICQSALKFILVSDGAGVRMRAKEVYEYVDSFLYSDILETHYLSTVLHSLTTDTNYSDIAAVFSQEIYCLATHDFSKDTNPSSSLELARKRAKQISRLAYLLSKHNASLFDAFSSTLEPIFEEIYKVELWMICKYKMTIREIIFKNETTAKCTSRTLHGRRVVDDGTDFINISVIDTLSRVDCDKQYSVVSEEVQHRINEQQNALSILYQNIPYKNTPSQPFLNICNNGDFEMSAPLSLLIPKHRPTAFLPANYHTWKSAFQNLHLDLHYLALTLHIRNSIESGSLVNKIKSLGIVHTLNVMEAQCGGSIVKRVLWSSFLSIYTCEFTVQNGMIRSGVAFDVPVETDTDTGTLNYSYSLIIHRIFLL